MDLARTEVKKYLGVGDNRQKETKKKGMYSTNVMNNLFNRSASASKKSKKKIYTSKTLNLELFEIFLDSLDKKQDEKSTREQIPSKSLEDFCGELKNLKDDQLLIKNLNLLKKVIKTKIKKLKNSKKSTPETVLINSDIFSQNKTISIKRNSSKKKYTADHPLMKSSTEKRTYENHNTGNIRLTRESKPIKLKEKPPDVSRREESVRSINSTEIHVRDYEQRNLLKSQFSNDLPGPNSHLFPKVKKQSMIHLDKKNGLIFKTEIKPKQSMKSMLLKSYNSTQFQQLKSPQKMMLLSQKFGNLMCSARSLISQDSGVFGFNTSNVADALGESAALLERKRRNRRQAIDRSLSKATQISQVKKPRAVRDSSLEMGMGMVSRDLLSVDKSVSKTSNLFQMGSDYQYSHTFIPEQISKKKRPLGLFTTLDHKHSDMDHPAQPSHEIGDSCFNPENRKKRVSKGHQKFASVNLDYLRLKTSNTEINELKSEISNMIEEEPKYHLKSKKYRPKKKEAKSGLLAAKNLISRVSANNFSKLGLSRKSGVKKKKTARKKKSKLTFQTLQSNLNHFNYFHTNTLKSKVKPRKEKTRNKSSTVKHSKRSFKPQSILKQKAGDKSLGNIPSLRVFPKQIQVKSDIKHLMHHKTKTKRSSKVVSRGHLEPHFQGDSSKKGAKLASSKQMIQAYKIKSKKIHQKMKKFTSIIGKMKKNALNSSDDKGFQVRQGQKDFFKSKRKSEMPSTHFESRGNHVFLANAGEAGRKKKQSKSKKKIGQFFSYLGYGEEVNAKKRKKKSGKKVRNVLNDFVRKA